MFGIFFFISKIKKLKKLFYAHLQKNIHYFLYMSGTHCIDNNLLWNRWKQWKRTNRTTV